MRWIDKQRIKFNWRVRGRLNTYEVIMEVGSTNGLNSKHLTRREARKAAREGARRAEDLRNDIKETNPDLLKHIFQTPTAYAVDLATYYKDKDKTVKERIDVCTERT